LLYPEANIEYLFTGDFDMPLGFLKKIFTRYSKISSEFIEKLEETLIEADVGMQVTEQIIDEIKRKKVASLEEAREIIKAIISDIIIEGEIIKREGLKVIIFCGVNGVGKTTSIAKLANYLRNHGYKIKLAAGDTFRAAGIEQLEVWAERLKLPVIKQQQGADPGAVVYDAISSALSDNDDYLIVDTAGRMHTREDLMREMEKIYKVAQKRIPQQNIENLVVIDATTGQNGFNQVSMFNQYLNITGIFLAKFDSSFKAGIILRISKELRIPIKFIGTGEKLEDISEFNKTIFIEKLFE